MDSKPTKGSPLATRALLAALAPRLRAFLVQRCAEEDGEYLVRESLTAIYTNGPCMIRGNP
ncbi:hypothetical protein PsB1_1550 [Candidatus Phycosocius spiralis]|uniref:Uncharacterized protein n=1 Tax=Candidatus Phycosocius spiralis TaxID=2815099 RepID=A0ABQ4PWS1_9PROT|nr:hypothetical protein PsB1_1550 [Candidatus Phycosocius spiralis]